MDIGHFNEEEFHQAFGDDLSSAKKQVVILSPFVTRARTDRYFPRFLTMQSIGVEINIYTKPKIEQTGILSVEYDSVAKRLKDANLKHVQRKSMHEKIAVIDGKILWHGSLNILSHNNTRESMLRIESEPVAEAILAELGILAVSKLSDVTPQESTDIRPCQVCGGQMRLFPEAWIWLCENSPNCPGTQFVHTDSLEHIHMADAAIDIECPACGGEMHRKGTVDIRIACASAACGFEFDGRLSRIIWGVIQRSSKT